MSNFKVWFDWNFSGVVWDLALKCQRFYKPVSVSHWVEIASTVTLPGRRRSPRGECLTKPIKLIIDGTSQNAEGIQESTATERPVRYVWVFQSILYLIKMFLCQFMAVVIVLIVQQHHKACTYVYKIAITFIRILVKSYNLAFQVVLFLMQNSIYLKQKLPFFYFITFNFGSIYFNGTAL